MTKATILLFTIAFIYVNCVPVIIDTDIGQDIDDSWALALSLKSPNMDIKLVLTANNDTTGRAQIVAKYLTLVGRDDVPIGIGLETEYKGVGPLFGWAANFNLKTYKGPLYTDGVTQAINIIRSSPEPVVILEIAPVPNIRAILQRAPELASKVIIKAMSGSYKVCYNGGAGPCPEYNVVANTTASQSMYSAPWRAMYTSPIDIGVSAFITGATYQKLLNPNNNIITKTLIECYRYWNAHGGWGDPNTGSTNLWDLTAAYMVFSDMSLLNFDPVHMIVNNQGDTVVDPSGRLINVAATWVAGGEQSWAELCVDKAISNSTITY